MEERLPRKLAAILYADVAGYSRLTGEDEDNTHRTLRAYLTLISSHIQEHDGRVVHYAGDAVLADFGTVVDALSCATTIQRELADRNSDVPDERKVQFRIGVNLGDVIVDENEIYGDGVNVAARLESLAEPGGICVSDAVRTAMGNKLGFRYDDMGAQEVKNIAEPVRSFHVRFRPGEERPAKVSTKPDGHGQKSETSPPCVAVLPFRFLGNPGEHEYLAAAVTESISSALSHFREYKIVEGDDVGFATYTLTGTLQLAGTRIRVSPQLSATDDGRKIWGEKFDRELADVFELQDEISAIVAAYLGEAIWQETARALAGKSKGDFTAMDWSYYATERIHRLTRADFVEAKKALEKAMALQSELLLPKFSLAFVLTVELGWGWTSDADKCRKTALALTEELLRKDPANANTHRLAARLYAYLGRSAEALTHSERAVALNPYDGDVLVFHAMTLNHAGRAEEAMTWAEKALRFNPQPPAYYRQVLMAAQFLAGDYAAALESLRRVEGALFPAMRYIAIAILQVNGCGKETASEVEMLLSEQPNSSVQLAKSLLESYEDQTQVNIVLNALRDAGLPHESQGK